MGELPVNLLGSESKQHLDLAYRCKKETFTLKCCSFAKLFEYNYKILKYTVTAASKTGIVGALVSSGLEAEQ